MRSPNVSVASDRLLGLGHFLHAALVRDAATVDLAPPFETFVTTLEAATATSAAALRALIVPRVAVRFSERQIEHAIRGLARGAQALEGGKSGGLITSALFPHGITAEVRPMGATQLESAHRLLDRLIAQTSAAPLRAFHEPLLRTAIADMSAQLASRDVATRAYDQAMANELGARADFCRAYDALGGALRSKFPKDRAAQSVFFDALPIRKGARGEPSAPPGVDASPSA